MSDAIRSVNPRPDEQEGLIYGRRYKLFRGGKYLGIATGTKDVNIGDSFQATVFDKEAGEEVREADYVGPADEQ